MRLSLLLLLSLGLNATAFASTPPLPRPCFADEYRQFDFWLGEWEVDGGLDGKTPVGKSSITRIANGCALHENWRSLQGGDGQSLNVFEQSAGHWTQFWIGADGIVLRLTGGLENGAMVLSGELPMPNNKIQLQRITWTPLPDGRVSQRWQTSDDGGANWQTSFLGFYKKVTE
jgi:hypothetical protein